MGEVLEMKFTKLCNIRSFASAAAVLTMALVAGCNQIGASLGLTDQIEQVSPAPIAPERLRVTLPKVGAEATLAPVAQKDAITVWQTLDGITLSFRNGVLTATRGLGEDLISSDISKTVSMLKGDTGNGHYPMIRTYLNGEDQTYYPAYQCRQSRELKQQVKIDDVPLSLRRLEEVCVSPNHTFTNIYWLNAERTIVKSRQWVSHNVGTMVTERVMR